MTTWWEHVLRYSRRDQLSFTVVMAASGLRLHSVPLPNLRSPLHRWPEGWATRAGDRVEHAARPAGTRPTRRCCAPRSRRSSTTDGDPHAWVWELEARMTAATANVRGSATGSSATQRPRTSLADGVRCRP